MRIGGDAIGEKIVSVVFCCVLFSIPVFSSQFQQRETNRVTLNFNIGWKFFKGDASGAQAIAFSDDSWATVHAPHPFEYMQGNISADGTYYRGIGWYRKHIKLDAAYQTRRITLYFEGVMTTAEVWINGTKLSTHYGGYMPFSYDITDKCTFGATENVIAIRVDNTYQKQVPPEFASSYPDRDAIDFEAFGGLYRDVYLHITDNLYIPDPVHDWSNNFVNQGGQFITFPTVTTASAEIKVDTWVENAASQAKNCKLVISLINANNSVVQTVEVTGNAAANSVTLITKSMTVASPNLWFPWKPERYSLQTVVYDGATAVDYIKTKIGIRKLTWTKTAGVYCNDQSFKIIGLDRHQTWPYVGQAVPNIQQRRDAEILHEAGCNFARCSHYLQDDAFMDACDSLGILLWVEIPDWLCGANPPSDQVWRARHFENIKAMVRTARNHPCVAIWSVGPNEGAQDVAFDQKLNDTCHREDPTRPTSTARADWLQQPLTNNVFDLYGGNWFLDVPASNPDPNTLGFLITEHTGHTFPTYRTDSENNLVSHSAKHEYMNKRTRGKAWIHGALGWCAFDYSVDNTNASPLYVRPHGVMDLYRIPKFAYYFYKSQSAPDNYDGSRHPMVFIESYYTSNSPTNRKVVTNCEQVKLYRNGELVGTLNSVANQPGENLAHPPVVFNNITFATGELKAEGLIKEQVVATHILKTPGTASAVSLVADPDTIEANGADFSRIIASVVDNNGTVVPTAANKISFTSNSLGFIIGDNPATAQAGIIAVLARANLASGVMTVNVSCSGLSSATVNIVVRPMNDPTGIALQEVKPLQAGYGTRVTIRPMIGNRIYLPKSSGKNKRIVSVFDLQGRLVYRSEVAGQVIDISKNNTIGLKLYIVQVREIRAKPAVK